MKEEAAEVHETERGKGDAALQTKEGKGGGAMVVDPKVAKMVLKTVEEETSAVKKTSGRSMEGELLMEKEVAKERAKEKKRQTAVKRKGEVLMQKMKGKRTNRVKDTENQKLRRCASTFKKTLAPKVNPAVIPTT